MFSIVKKKTLKFFKLKQKNNQEEKAIARYYLFFKSLYIRNNILFG
jgi:hypothetical protein